MVDYYCDLSEDTFSDATGLDHAGNEYTSPAGFQAAIRGTGNATALAAGDTLHLTGTGDQSRLVIINCNGTSVVNWGIGDVVHNKDAGSTWQGVVVETNSGAFLGADDTALVWLDSGYDETDILIAEGVTNDDAGGGAGDPTDVDPLALRGTPGNQIDNGTGTALLTISLIGVNASWDEDGISLAILDGSDGGGTARAINNINATGPDNFTCKHIHCKDCIGTGWKSSGSSIGWYFDNCISEGAGVFGWGAQHTNWSSAKLYRCQVYDVGGYGFYIYLGTLVSCVAYDCAIYGFRLRYTTAINCTAYQCGTAGYWMNDGGCIYNCVADDNVNGVSVANIGEHLIFGCRITNNSTNGVLAAGVFYDPYTFYGGNTANFSAALGDDTVNGVSTRIISDVVTDIGYTDPATRDYSTLMGSSGYRTPIEMAGNSSAAISRGLPHMIHPEIGE